MIKKRSESKSEGNWNSDYQEFLSSTEVLPPGQLSEQIISRVRLELNPASWQVFLKLSAIHAVFGTLTLLFCPQFGLSRLSGMGLMHVFMEYGEVACMLGCGAVYIGSSALAASFLLRPDEMKVLRRTESLQIALLGLLSIGGFFCFGASIVFEAAIIAWFFGSILGGIATLELGWLIRRTVFSIK